MKIFYVLCIWTFLSEIKVSATDEIERHGYTGKDVIITCTHGWASTNRKYFCRDACNNKDVLVSSDQSPNGRFTLKDFRNGTFTVTISDLQETDSGLYWCGVDRVGKDLYNKVTLKASKDVTPTSTKFDTTQPVTTPTPQSESSFATSTRTPDDITRSPSITVSVNISLYAVIGLVITVIIFLFGLFAVYQCRTRVKTSAGRVPVTSVNKHSELRVEEVNNKNDLQDTQRSKQKKSKKLKPEVPKSQIHSVYENLNLNMDQSDVVYGNP